MKWFIQSKIWESRYAIIRGKNIGFCITLGIHTIVSAVLAFIAHFHPDTITITIGQLYGAIVFGDLVGICIAKGIVDLILAFVANKENCYQVTVINKAMDILTDDRLSDVEKKMKITTLIEGASQK